jgi:hypothetical protein
MMTERTSVSARAAGEREPAQPERIRGRLGLDVIEQAARLGEGELALEDVVEDPVDEREALQVGAPVLHAHHAHQGWILRPLVVERDEQPGGDGERVGAVALEHGHGRDQGLDAVRGAAVRQEGAAEIEEVLDQLGGGQRRRRLPGGLHP